MCGYGYVYIGKVASSETENLKYFLGSSVIQERLRVQHFPLYFKKETTQRGLSIWLRCFLSTSQVRCFRHVPQEEDSETLRPRTHWRNRVCRLILESLTVLARKILSDNYTEMETGRLASLEKLFFSRTSHNASAWSQSYGIKWAKVVVILAPRTAGDIFQLWDCSCWMAGWKLPPTPNWEALQSVLLIKN